MKYQEAYFSQIDVIADRKDRNPRAAPVGAWSGESIPFIRRRAAEATDRNDVTALEVLLVADPKDTSMTVNEPESGTELTLLIFAAHDSPWGGCAPHPVSQRQTFFAAWLLAKPAELFLQTPVELLPRLPCEVSS